MGDRPRLLVLDRSRRDRSVKLGDSSGPGANAVLGHRELRRRGSGHRRRFRRKPNRTDSGSRYWKPLPFPLTVLQNPARQGYGGNQKIGFHYAIQRGFQYVALVHGGGKYAPECLPDLMTPLTAGQAEAVYGSRMLKPAEARRGMPLYKYLGNLVLSRIQSWLLRTRLSEFHSGYRAYSTAALGRIPFPFNSNGLHFDTEITIQLLLSDARIMEAPIPAVSRRRDFFRHRPEVFLERPGDVPEGARAGAIPVLRSQIRLHPVHVEQRPLQAAARIREHAHDRARAASRPAHACSILAAPAATSAGCSASADVARRESIGFPSTPAIPSRRFICTI